MDRPRAARLWKFVIRSSQSRGHHLKSILDLQRQTILHHDVILTAGRATRAKFTANRLDESSLLSSVDPSGTYYIAGMMKTSHI